MRPLKDFLRLFSKVYLTRLDRHGFTAHNDAGAILLKQLRLYSNEGLEFEMTVSV